MAKPSRALGTNPRALRRAARDLGITPRDLGINPRALGITPRQFLALDPVQRAEKKASIINGRP